MVQKCLFMGKTNKKLRKYPMLKAGIQENKQAMRKCISPID